MYKVFLNDRIILLTDNSHKCFISSNFLFVNYTSQIILLKTFKKFYKNIEIPELIIYHADIEELKKHFFSLFISINAGGGLVCNNSNQYLFILRNNMWDLPKGKVETNESIDIAAIREVEEETGLTNVKIIDFAIHTFHIYKLETKFIIKTTHWYNMIYEGNEIPKPQIEENITKAMWINKNEVNLLIQNTYKSILEVININK